MPRPFQEWASDEIRRLRAEAESLELALRKYLASEATETPGKTNGSKHLRSTTQFREPTRPPQSQPRNRNRSGRPKHVPKNSLLVDFINRAGADGVTADEVYRFAKEGPIGIETNASRAMLWDLNRKGRVVKHDDRYYGPEARKPGSKDPGLPLEH
jgi:hypothetical protein